MRDNKTEAFFALIRSGIGHQVRFTPTDVDWDAIYNFAVQQGLSAIIVDGVDKILDTYKPPKPVLLQWIGETLQGYEYRYELYCRAISELAAFYNTNGFKMMVLKGYACSLDWPKPEHRPCGDIDIWLFGKQKEADAAIAKEKGIKIDSGHHHHTVFYWRDFMVENHYDFINVHHNNSNPELEKIFKELGADDSYSIEIYGEKVFLPSPNLHALFLIRHAASHFAAEGINLRQVLDWAFYVDKHTKQIDWAWLLSILDKYNMMDFYNCMNAICVEDLGFPVDIFPTVQFSPQLKEEVLIDILYPKYQHEPPAHLIPRLIFKYNRWRDFRWKRKLCFQESEFLGLIIGLRAHFKKPMSI